MRRRSIVFVVVVLVLVVAQSSCKNNGLFVLKKDAPILCVYSYGKTRKAHLKVYDQKLYADFLNGERSIYDLKKLRDIYFRNWLDIYLPDKDQAIGVVRVAVCKKYGAEEIGEYKKIRKDVASVVASSYDGYIGINGVDKNAQMKLRACEILPLQEDSDNEKKCTEVRTKLTNVMRDFEIERMDCVDYYLEGVINNFKAASCVEKSKGKMTRFVANIPTKGNYKVDYNMFVSGLKAHRLTRARLDYFYKQLLGTGLEEKKIEQIHLLGEGQRRALRLWLIGKLTAQDEITVLEIFGEISKERARLIAERERVAKKRRKQAEKEAKRKIDVIEGKYKINKEKSKNGVQPDRINDEKVIVDDGADKNEPESDVERKVEKGNLDADKINEEGGVIGGTQNIKKEEFKKSGKNRIGNENDDEYWKNAAKKIRECLEKIPYSQSVKEDWRKFRKSLSYYLGISQN